MKLSDIDQEKIDKLNEGAVGFIIIANKNDNHTMSITGDFNIETLLSMGIGLINRSLNMIPKSVKDSVIEELKERVGETDGDI